MRGRRRTGQCCSACRGAGLRWRHSPRRTDSSTCPSPANPSFEAYYNGSFVEGGSPAWQGYGSAYPGTYHAFQYGPLWDNSHIPSLFILPYLLTADAAFEEMAIFQATATFCGFDQGARNFTYNGTAFENVVLGLYQMEGAERAGANAIRHLGSTDRMMRDGHPMRGFVKRALSQNAACAGGAPNMPYSVPSLAALGNMFSLMGDVGGSVGGSGYPFPHLFMVHLLAFMVGVEAGIGEYPGWVTLLKALQPLFIGLYDTQNGSSSYNLTVYNVPMTANGSTAYSSMSQVISANGLGAGSAPSTGFLYGTSGDQGLGTVSSLPRAAIFQAAAIPGNPIPRATQVAQDLYSRYKATYPSQPGYISYTTGAHAGFWPQFAIAPPPGVS